MAVSEHRERLLWRPTLVRRRSLGWVARYQGHSVSGPLRAALDAVLGQDYPGQLRVIVVYDRAEPVLKPNDSMAVLVNDRTPGLAGARNTGIVKLDTDLVAFCDDDVWQPGKLRKQVWALRARPGTELALGRNWHERRVPFALAVASGVVPGEFVLRQLNARGHGI